ncbi:MAG: sensor histidine kinase [Chthonomonadales bacterium]|nr:sensor histidine kinase [Chthonomonadales bacterium]
MMIQRLRRAFDLRSVRTRLMVWNIGIVILLLAVLGGIVEVSVDRVLLSAMDNDLLKNTGTVMAQAQEFLLRDRDQDRYKPGGSDGPPKELLPEKWRGTVESAHVLEALRRNPSIPRIFNGSGRAMRPYEKLGAWDGTALHRAMQGEEVHSTVLIGGESVRVLTQTVRWRGQILGAVQAARPLGDTRQAMVTVRHTLLALVPVGLLFAGLAGAVVTGRALQPVRKIARSADLIHAEDLTQRLQVEGYDEFSYLSATFNRMLSRLEGSFTEQRALVSQLERLLEEQKRFTADASHELKTPLSVAKVHAGLLLHTGLTEQEYRESAHAIDDATDRMSRLVQDLLLLAQADAGRVNQRSTVLVVQDLLYQARHLQSGTAGASILIAEDNATLTVEGDEDKLVRVFANLLSNARQHTPEAGEIHVSSAEENAQVLVHISDTGEGIAPEHLPHLGDRFYRVDSARGRPQGGAGLGLSICKSIVEQHGGSLAFKSAVGQGTTAIVTLPAASLPLQSH